VSELEELTDALRVQPDGVAVLEVRCHVATAACSTSG
jgi:hypothetical protein